MRHGFDTSDPGELSIQGFDVAAGYLGGRTPHQWTVKQWEAQPARWRTPFWVYDRTADAVSSAEMAVTRWQQLGAPDGTVIWLDMETEIDPEWVNLFADKVHSLRHFTGCYGSTSTLFRNPVRSGYFVADPTGTSHLYEHPHSVATQYGQTTVHPGGLTVDLDVYADACPLWDTRPPAAVILPKWAQQAAGDLNTIAQHALAVRSLIIDNTK